jgi:hypothetical protein
MADAPAEPNTPADTAAEGEITDPPIVSRTDPESDAAAADRANEKPAKTKRTSGALNAGSVDNEYQAPDAVSQSTGNSPGKSFPAPTPTRDSAVHQLNLKVAELKYHISDWNHKVDDKTQALIDFINDY